MTIFFQFVPPQKTSHIDFIDRMFFNRQHEKVLSVNTEFKHKLCSGIGSQISTFLLKLLDNIVLVSVCDLSKVDNSSSVIQ